MKVGVRRAGEAEHERGGFLPHLPEEPSRQPQGPSSPLPIALREYQLPKLAQPQGGPSSSLIHLEHTLPTCKSHRQQDALLSAGPGANPTPATTVGASQGSAQAMPTQPPSAYRHKAAIIVNRLSQILCVPPAAQHGPLGPQPCLGFWAPQATTHSATALGCAWSDRALGAQSPPKWVGAVGSLKPGKEADLSAQTGSLIALLFPHLSTQLLGY